MIRLAVILLCLLAIPARAAEPDAVLVEMRSLEARRGEAIRTGDFAALRRIYARDFHGRTAGNQQVDRDALFAIFRRNLGTPQNAESRIERVQLMGPDLRVHGMLTFFEPGTRRIRGGSNFIHYFRRRHGRWELYYGEAFPWPTPPGPAPR